jgi:hypothetical protein
MESIPKSSQVPVTEWAKHLKIFASGWTLQIFVKS